MHSQKVLQQRIKELKAALSDQNLELIPDYEQRIDVLKELRFVDENATVLLKGRVACEVGSFILVWLPEPDCIWRSTQQTSLFLPSSFSKTR